MTNSPMWRWCSTVVGKSLMPRIVLENMAATPAMQASASVKPKAYNTPKPTAKKAAELPNAVSTDLRNRSLSLFGGRSRPTR